DFVGSCTVEISFATHWFLSSIKFRLWHFPETLQIRPYQSWAPPIQALTSLVLVAVFELLGPWEYFLDWQRLNSGYENSQQQDVLIMYGMTNISSHVDPKGS